MHQTRAQSQRPRLLCRGKGAVSQEPCLSGWASMVIELGGPVKDSLRGACNAEPPFDSTRESTGDIHQAGNHALARGLRLLGNILP